MEKRNIDKPWWKRKEYKIPEEHFKVFKRPDNINIRRFHKRVSYHNSSQFRHWILGMAIIMAFISLGTSFKRTYSSLCKWSVQEGENGPSIPRLQYKIFGSASNENTGHQLIMARGVKLWKYLNANKHNGQTKRTPVSDNQDKTGSTEDTPKMNDCSDDDGWESVEGM